MITVTSILLYASHGALGSLLLFVEKIGVCWAPHAPKEVLKSIYF